MPFAERVEHPMPICVLNSVNSEITYAFPLAIFLFPGERIQLHLFEPRYRQLFKLMEEHHLTCAVPYVKNNKPQRIGCALRLQDVETRYDDGRVDAVFECTQLIEITKYDRSGNSAMPDSAEFTELHRYALWQASPALLDEWRLLTEIWPKLSGKISRINIVHVLHIYQILRPTYEEKYNFIALGDPSKQEQVVFNKIRYQRMLLEQERHVEKGIFLN